MPLNKYQKKIVDHRHDAETIVVDACPGSGKTYTVENVVAALLEEGQRVGVFTFSRKAAEEMRLRIAERLFDLSPEEREFFRDPFESSLTAERLTYDSAAVSMLVDWTCTIHAMSYRLLKSTGQKPRVLSGSAEWEVRNLIDDRRKEMGYKEGWKALVVWFDHATINLIEPERARSFYNQALADTMNGSWHARCLAALYHDYVQFCRQRNLIDFAMMQAKVIKLLRTDAGFANKVASLFDYVIIDEAQDTSSHQMEIVNALTAQNARLMMVGDVDQSMYAFRGATPEVLHNTESKRFVLPINYRSTVEIIDRAVNLIETNYVDKPDLLKPFEPRPDAPAGIEVEPIITGSVEGLGSEISQVIMNDEIEPGDVFVLSRTRAECALLHTELLGAGIKAINKSGGLLFGAPHIRKVLAYARLACNYEGARNQIEILEEIANVATADFLAPMSRRRHLDGCNNTKSWVDCGCPTIMKEGVDHSSARFYGKAAVNAAGSWEGVVGQQYETNRGGYPTLNAKGARDLVEFVLKVEQQVDDAEAALRIIIDECVLPWLTDRQGITETDLSENGIVEDFDVLTTLVEEGQSLEDYLSMVDCLSDDNPSSEDDSVLVGTFHWSKGAERPVVFVNATRCPIIPPKTQEGRLPTGKPATLKEERRLIYVGLTRAKTNAYFCMATTWNNKPAGSIFIDEVFRKQSV